MPFHLDQHLIKSIFIGIWLLLFAGIVIVNLVAPPALKQKGQRIMPIFGGLLFLFFIYLLTGKRDFLFLIIPIGLIIYVNVKTVRICLKCGTTNRNPYMFPVPKFCLKCGSMLDGTSKGQ
jgi:hypothetical protein